MFVYKCLAAVNFDHEYQLYFDSLFAYGIPIACQESLAYQETLPQNSIIYQYDEIQVCQRSFATYCIC